MRTMRLVALTAVLLLIQSGCGSSSDPVPPWTPPALPTHHSKVVGRVIDGAGQPQAGLRISVEGTAVSLGSYTVAGVSHALYAPTDSARNTTDSAGAFELPLEAVVYRDRAVFNSLADATISITILRPGPPGGLGVTETHTLTVSFVPLAQSMQTTQVEFVWRK